MQWTGSHHLHLRGANWTTERKKMNILGKGKWPGTHNNIELGFFQCPFFCFSVTEHMPEPQPQTAWACDSPDGNCHYSNRPGTLLQVSWSCTLCVKGRKQLALYKGQMWCFALKAPPPQPVQQFSPQILALGGCLKCWPQTLWDNSNNSKEF